jgi:hypothetical protein
MNIRFISFHNGNIPAKVLEAQKAVFNDFNYPLEQIFTKLQHPYAIDNFLNNEAWDIAVIFDIDCIPLDGEYLWKEIGFVTRRRWLIGAAQHASHIPNSIDYMSPAFMILHRELWEQMGKPSFLPTERGDVGAEITYKALEHNLHYFMLPVEAVEVPMWELASGKKFGIGTNYGDVIYHAFESRMNGDARSRFIQKCSQVIAQVPAPDPAQFRAPQ